MSKIEVNTVDVQCGTNLTVGSACKSVTVAGNDVRSNAYKAADGGNIASQSGTTITLGASGDTITLASGASQSGFGRTGTVDWQTGSIKTGNFTAASGEGYFINTTSGAITMSLPAGSAGAIVSVQDYANTFDSNALTINPNGSEKINGGTAGAGIFVSTESQGLTFVYIDSTQGWKTVQDNTFGTAGSVYVAATGGTITTVCTNFKVHTFTGPGTFCVSAAGSPSGSNTVDYLVLAGGGSGGSRDRAGGGGAGGYRESPGSASGCYTASPLGSSPAAALPVSVQGYPITVGAGASANPPASRGNQGSTSTFSTISSAGGGAGGGDAPDDAANLNGGSGGGRGVGGLPCGPVVPGGAGNTPPVSPPQGQNGGGGQHNGNGGSGGGGGAGAVGVNGNGNVPGQGGAGGAGVASSITGSPVTRAGGGGGLGDQGPRPGGSGGGGAGANIPPGNNGTAGSANTGGGGGGSANSGTGGAGGSGVVIIRYKFQN